MWCGCVHAWVGRQCGVGVCMGGWVGGVVWVHACLGRWVGRQCGMGASMHGWVGG